MSGRKSKAAAQAGSPAMSTVQFVATAGGLGRIPRAPGTLGSLIGAALCLPLLGLGWPLHLAATVVLCGAALVASGRAAAELGQPDPPQVVIDEIAGMSVALLALPFQWYDLGAVFLLFRLFDVVKPAPIPRLERLPGGFGIVADDIAAGLLARVTWWLLKANFDFL
jgi:phosphatidylglycerophosphatase A